MIWALAAVSQLHRKPFDAALLQREFPPPYSLDTLIEAAKRLGFRAGAHGSAAEELATATLPCLVLLLPDPAQSQPAPLSGDGNESEICILLRVEAGLLHVVEPQAAAPRAIAFQDFATRFAGQIVQIAPEPQSPGDPDAAAVRATRFGFGWFVPELLKHKAVWRDVILASAAIQLLALATPLFTQVVIDKVIVHQTTNTLAVIGIALLAVMAFTGAMSWVRQYLVLHTGNRVDAVLGTRVFEHLLGLPLRYFESRPTGTIVARLHGVETICEFVSGAAVTLVLDLPFLGLFLALMLWYSWALTLIALAIIAAIVTLSLVIVPLIRARLNHQFLLGARNQAFVTEYVAGMETVKSLQMEPQLKNRFGEYLSSYLVAGFNTRQLSNTYGVAANSLDQLMTLAILVVGAWHVMTHDGFTIGMLVAFQMFATRISQPMLRLVGLWQEFQQAAVAVKRLGDIMDQPTEPHSLVPARARQGVVAVAIEAISFRYADNLPYLYQGLTVQVPAGGCVAVMGPSGCGKSTLAKLLQGFYAPSEGRILIAGRDVRTFAANELRAHLGVVPQETVLFSGTIYENLVLASPHATFQQVTQACLMAEIHEFIEKLPDGYQTRIGEHGVGLSGGQRQRVAIARALLKRPRVLVFDEATSNLDPETAEHFARTVNHLKGHVTMLFIAHQLPRGLQVDDVVRLGGKPMLRSVSGEGSKL